MALTSGSKLGSYEILSLLGAYWTQRPAGIVFSGNWSTVPAESLSPPMARRSSIPRSWARAAT